MLEIFGVTEENWRESTTAPPGFVTSETPRFVGRAIVALASDPDRHRWHRQSVDVGALAREYGFTDVDGSQPDCWRYMEVTEAGVDADPADFR